MEALELVLASFTPVQGANPAMVAKAYLKAVEGISVEAVEDAADRYNRGLVPDQDARFAPSAAQFAQYARSRQEMLEIRQKYENVTKLAVVHDDSPRVSPEKIQEWQKAMRDGPAALDVFAAKIKSRSVS